MFGVDQGETPRVTREYQATQFSSGAAPLADVLAVWSKHQNQHALQLHPDPGEKEQRQAPAKDTILPSLGHTASANSGTVNQVDLSAGGEWWGSLAYLPLEASRYTYLPFGNHCPACDHGLTTALDAVLCIWRSRRFDLYEHQPRLAMAQCSHLGKFTWANPNTV